MNKTTITENKWTVTTHSCAKGYTYALIFEGVTHARASGSDGHRTLTAQAGFLNERGYIPTKKPLTPKESRELTMAQIPEMFPGFAFKPKPRRTF